MGTRWWLDQGGGLRSEAGVVVGRSWWGRGSLLGVAEWEGLQPCLGKEAVTRLTREEVESVAAACPVKHGGA